MKDFEASKQDKLAKLDKQLQLESPDLALLAQAMFTEVLAEDIDQHSVGDLQTIAVETLKTMQKRKSGTSTIKLNPITLSSGKELTCVCIINDNMPFLTDSVISELHEKGSKIHLVTHPLINTKRSKAGALESISLTKDSDQEIPLESIIYLQIAPLEKKEQKALEEDLTSLLNDLRQVVSDWPAMLEKIKSAVETYKTTPPPVEVQHLAEAIQFLDWITNNNFTFLGVREYAIDDASETGISVVDDSSLGILSNPDVHVLRRGKEFVAMSAEVREFLFQPEPLIITKANVKSRIHRRAHMDYIGVKRYNKNGKVCGEIRFIGLFTSTVYVHSIADIPYLRHKANRVMQNSGHGKKNHAGKVLWNILESYPRDELFQIDSDTLTGFANAVLALDGREKVRVLPRWDKFDRFVSLMVYVPKERYNTNVRLAIGQHLKTVYEGRVSAYYPTFPEGMLARVHFIIGRYGGEKPTVLQADLEDAIERIITTWQDDFDSISDKANDPYRDAFTAAYREAFHPLDAVKDITQLQTLTHEDQLAVTFYEDQTTGDLGLKVYHLETPIELSSRVPLLENLGFKVINERTYKITPDMGQTAYIHDMSIEAASGEAVELSKARALLEEAVLSIWNGEADNDALNTLILSGGLPARKVALLRTISRYMQQIGVQYSQPYIARALNANAALAVKLTELFEARFHPEKNSDKEQSKLIKAIDTALEAVSSLDEDQIIRRMRAIIMGTVRTNFYQTGFEGNPKSIISLKLTPQEMEGIPEPRPYREIFVSGPEVEGLHLRFGKVARGGLRWSDRPEDFRTEVLGLVKAQQVKNAVIVPVGSKGGFIAKKLSPTMGREEFLTVGTEAYKTFISSLLEITDNYEGEAVVHPQHVVRHEEDDPYLVVAADKGTATFSDTANAISQAHNFWLDDAFASGGSAGYDHKKMGITAKGGWEAVKRHFREMNHDIQSKPFTAAGVGDMSGDVFGNGMLLSKATKLVAAFDHRDIFIDPDPDPATTYVERERLFNLGRSSWQDYNKKLLSKGGGIFPRSSKSISLSKEIQALLDIKKASVTPFELMQAIISMRVDLLWFGGIGTYIRGSQETNAEAGDRANDAIRVEAKKVRAKVIGEGANLGVTQRGRIALANQGARLNSDAIDNSAGVNSSDVEVNIKIALSAAIETDKLTLKKRNILLEKMTDDVSALVLRNNYLQTLSLSLTERAGMDDFSNQHHLMQTLEGRGLLDRAVEDLPDDITMDERAINNEPLVRPELGVLLAYAKLTLFDDLLRSDTPDDPYMEKELTRYFPSAMQKTYTDEINTHRLRREIIATQLANAMINRGGATYIEQIQSQTNATPAKIARAYVIVREAFGLQKLHEDIDTLDTKIDGGLQLELYAACRNLLIHQTGWVLRHIDLEQNVEEASKPLYEAVKKLTPKLANLCPPYLQEKQKTQARTLIEQGVPKGTAEHVALLTALARVPDIMLVAHATNSPLTHTASFYFNLAETFHISKIASAARALSTEDYYDSLALIRVIQTLARAHRGLTTFVLQNYEDKNGIQTWHDENAEAITSISNDIAQILDTEAMTVSKLSVAANLIGDI